MSKVLYTLAGGSLYFAAIKPIDKPSTGFEDINFL
jgi:hypothetical protein